MSSGVCRRSARGRLALSGAVLAGIALVLSGSGCGLTADHAKGAAGPGSTGAMGVPMAQAAMPAPDQRRSGWHFMSTATQALQDDDAQNPAFLWVRDGEQRFARHCAGCHAGEALRGVATRYPAFDAALGRAVTLGERIRLCHERHRRERPPAWESDELLALESHLAHQARGLGIAPPADPRLEPQRAEGRRLWAQRLGQVALSCADCHDGLAGRRLAGSTIPQGHPTGYPAYRLEWQALGSLQRRLRGCLSGVRAEPWPAGDPAWVALELHLMQRASGMAVDAPAVRP